MKALLWWTELGAVPETFLTVRGCLEVTNALAGAPHVVVRPGATALGLAIARIVNRLGGRLVGVTRSEHEVETVREGGMAEVLVTSGDVADRILDRWPAGATTVVDTIVSAATVRDDLAMRSDHGVVCLSGSLAESYGTEEVGEFVSSAFERPDVPATP